MTEKMRRSLPVLVQRPLSLIFSLFVLCFIHTCCYGDVGTAAHYSVPYLPTHCYGNDANQFPSNNAGAGDGIWDNDAACGRQYLVRCISASTPLVCSPNSTIQVKIVDYVGGLVSPPSAPNTTMVLSITAFQAIGGSTSRSMNIEFQKV